MLKMGDTTKVKLLTWGALFLLFFTFITFTLWIGTTIWWLLTNNMIDRNIFLLISTTTSLTLVFVIVISEIIYPKNKSK